MNFDWQGYLTLAKELGGQPEAKANSESKLRSSMSRSYYAAFQLAKQHLIVKDGNTKVPDDGYAHSFVPDEFLESHDANRRKIGSNLKRLKTNRNKADYHDNINNVVSLTETSLLMADDTVLKLSII
ncbi:MAG: DNA-binding protein [Deltaproteobacteria bacterium]|nr:DNA-binding protein [Deltaproteobacteria bacterium]